MYATTGGSPSNTSNGGSGGSGGNSSGSNGNNGTGATSPPTGPPPPLPPPHPTHFYAPAAPPPHHHPPVQAGPPPPPAQVDHLYYPFATGPHPALPPPPHASMGLTEQQLLLYTTDATSCQQTSTSDSQTVPQEDSRPTPSHSEQPHGETQQASSGSPATPLVPLMPVKFPVSGRYHANYHPIAIHTAPQNDSEDCTSPMHCRAILYPTVYISHTHAPPPYTHHNASSGSLLPTPFSASPRQSNYDINTKTHGHNSRDCSGNKYIGGQGSNNNLRGQGNQSHGYSLNTHASKSQNTQSGSQSHNSGRCSGNIGTADGFSHKYSTIAVSSRLPVQYNRRTAGSNVGSSAILRSGSGGYGSSQAAHKFNHSTASNYGGSHKSSNAIHGYEYSSNGRARNYSDDQYYEIGAAGNNRSMGNGGYGSTNRRNYLSNNNYRGGAARLTDLHVGSDNNDRPNNNDAPKTDNAAVVVTSTTSTTTTTLSSRLSPAERTNADNNTSKDAQEKPASPPPAPYSPMTRPLPTLSPPTPQVQFYAPVQNRYQPPSMPSSQPQQQQQQSINSQRSRYSVGQTLANRKPSDKYSNATGSSQTMLRQSAKYKVNGIMQTATTTVTSKLADDNLGGAGDGPGRLPITPPGTPRASGHPAAGDQNQLSDTCHQMQALTL